MASETLATGLVITGMGITSAAGSDVDSFWNQVRGGHSPAQWWADPERPKAMPIPACRISEPNIAPELARWARKSDRCAQLALAAGWQAGQQARLAGLDRARLGVIVGSARGPVGAMADAVREVQRGLVHPILAASSTCASPSGVLSLVCHAEGPCFTVSASCASAANAIALGAMQILAGEADVVLAGGAEAPLVSAVIEPFRKAGILAHHEDPRKACRPFDRSRNGLLLGEGAAFLVLETEDHARRRGAQPIARLLGWAMTADGRGRTSPRLDGAGLIRAMTAAMRRARINPECIDYINVHGTGTVVNDRVESLALRRLLGALNRRIPVSSTKPVTGHCLGATPALEAVVTIQTLLHQEIPPTINHEEPEDVWDLDFVSKTSRPAPVKTVLSISQGFWGNNAALVFGHA